MIARSWTGAVPRDKGDDYAAYVEQTGVRELRDTPGNRGVYVLTRSVGDAVEFTVLSLWDSVDSIRRFAGEEIDKARYYPRDRDYLFTMAQTVSHFEARAWLPPAALAHIDLRVSDKDAARKFYDAILPVVGYPSIEAGEEWVSYVRNDDRSFVGFAVQDDHQPTPGRIAFRLAGRSDVDRAGAAVTAAGALKIEGPLPCPEYSESYYAVFFEDRDGNRFEVYSDAR